MKADLAREQGKGGDVDKVRPVAGTTAEAAEIPWAERTCDRGGEWRRASQNGVVT